MAKKIRWLVDRQDLGAVKGKLATFYDETQAKALVDDNIAEYVGKAAKEEDPGNGDDGKKAAAGPKANKMVGSAENK